MSEDLEQRGACAGCGKTIVYDEETDNWVNWIDVKGREPFPGLDAHTCSPRLSRRDRIATGIFIFLWLGLLLLMIIFFDVLPDWALITGASVWIATWLFGSIGWFRKDR